MKWIFGLLSILILISVSSQDRFPSFQEREVTMDSIHPVVAPVHHDMMSDTTLHPPPTQKLPIHVMPDLRVIPGGQTIGLKLKSDGVLVVGHHLIKTTEEEKQSPGQAVGIQKGDWITHINHERIHGIQQVSELVQDAGAKHKTIVATIKRNEEEPTEVTIQPVLDAKDQTYRLGLYIRDSAAGIGTLTFYAPDQGVYGALGHLITDVETQTPMTVGGGQILHSSVTSISKSRNGNPGEKKAHLFHSGKVLGNIEKNSQFGIFGQMHEKPDFSATDQPIPVAFVDEVKEGPAKIYTVVKGQKVESFDIEITHVSNQEKPDTKGLVIKIVDPRLIEETGGIVQGMSGSPIIQEGKLVGAVTHVFVNDPTSGYGCHVEWMLQESGITLRSMLESSSAA